MRGPFPLLPLQVEMHVPPRVGGVYLLGKDPKRVSLIVRTDKDMREALKGLREKYRFFSFETAVNRNEAFLIHCRLFHKYEDAGLDDTAHPERPPDSTLKCPVCGK
jgi:hypothetical protein